MADNLVGINVYWKKKGSDEEKVTFVSVPNHDDNWPAIHRDAWNRVLKIKGRANIDVIKSQCYDRNDKTLLGDVFLYSED